MKFEYISITLVILLIFILGFKKIYKDININSSNIDKEHNDQDIETIYLAGGCFWGVEEFFDRIDGVVSSVSGYANGNTENPIYEDVIYKNTNHAEAVEVKYNIKKTSLKDLLTYYFKIIDPTILNKQGNDVGTQYRTGIYYTKGSQLGVIEEIIVEEQKNIKNQL